MCLGASVSVRVHGGGFLVGGEGGEAVTQARLMRLLLPSCGLDDEPMRAITAVFRASSASSSAPLSSSAADTSFPNGMTRAATWRRRLRQARIIATMIIAAASKIATTITARSHTKLSSSASLRGSMPEAGASPEEFAVVWLVTAADMALVSHPS